MQDKIDQYLQDFIKNYDLPGLAVGIVKDQEIIFNQGYGLMNIEEEQPITSRSVFHTASISKTFVATGILQLVEEGKLGLQDLVIDHLPYFELKDPRYKLITVQQMLSHVSGMSDEADYHWEAPEFDDGALERFVRGLADMDNMIIFELDERFSYSNIAYEVLGDLLAKKRGLTFEEAIRQYIFEPLSMSESTFLKTEVLPKLATTPHSHSYKNEVSEIYPYNRAHAPSSTFHSNTTDMCKYILAHLGQGELNGKRIMKTETHQQMWEPRKEVSADRIFAKQIGLGWFIGERGGVKTTGHGGHDIGYQNNLVLLPSLNMGLVHFCNGAPIPVEKLSAGLVDILLGTEPEAPQTPPYISLGYAHEAAGLPGLREKFAELRASGLEQPEILQSIYELLEGLIEAKKFEQAQAFLEFILELDAENAKAYELMAMLSFYKGDMQKTIEYAKRSLEINPDNEVLLARVRQFSGN